MKRTGVQLVILFLLLGGGVLAQESHRDPIKRHLFPPELIMRHQEILQLTPQQREEIIGEIQQAQAQFTALQWNLRSEVEALSRLLVSDQVNEGQLLDQLDAVLELERQVKRAHLLLAIRIKNSLSPAQQQKLHELR